MRKMNSTEKLKIFKDSIRKLLIILILSINIVHSANPNIIIRLHDKQLNKTYVNLERIVIFHNKTYELDCEVMDTNSTIDWYRYESYRLNTCEGGPVKSVDCENTTRSNSSTSKCISIIAKYDDAATYSCKTLTTETNFDRNITIDVVKEEFQRKVPPPKLNKDKKFEVELGENLNIECKGPEELKWIWPIKNKNNTIMYENRTYDGDYVIGIQITSVGYENVGFYACCYIGRECIAENFTSTAYLFVHYSSNNYLINPVNPELFPLVYRGLPGIIACLPVCPHINVSLWINSMKVGGIKNEIVKIYPSMADRYGSQFGQSVARQRSRIDRFPFQYISYDNTFGFLNYTERGNYSCEFSDGRNSKLVEVNWTKFESETGLVVYATDENPYEADFVELVCSTGHATGRLKWKWRRTNESVDVDVTFENNYGIRVLPSYGYRMREAKLQFPSITFVNSGIYRCIVESEYIPSKCHAYASKQIRIEIKKSCGSIRNEINESENTWEDYCRIFEKTQCIMINDEPKCRCEYNLPFDDDTGKCTGNCSIKRGVLNVTWEEFCNANEDGKCDIVDDKPICVCSNNYLYDEILNECKGNCSTMRTDVIQTWEEYCDAIDFASCVVRENKPTCLCSNNFIFDEKTKCKGNLKSIVLQIVYYVAPVLILIIFVIVGLVLRKKILKRQDEQWIDIVNEIMHVRDNPTPYNPEVPMKEQTESLPYDDKWEFPTNRLKFGNLLGKGAFGKVIEAEAIGIEPNKCLTTVAVKMLKGRAEIDEFRALMAELKIYIHIGRHINVVNLLGAVTKNALKGELMIIVEHCRFGNIRNYLINNRKNFINQLSTDIGEESRTSCNLTSSITDKSSQKTLNVAIPYSEKIDSICSNDSRRVSIKKEVYEESVVDNKNINSTKKSVYNTSSDNTKNNYSTNVEEFLTTSDLLSFACQAARGMEFLASKKLIHRDLAARNVLLADNKVLKICDFGLTKETYKYVKKVEDALPIRWMAIESLREKVFTTKSDVWSFGVLLWEIFTLGVHPYPGIEANIELYKLLKNGYRMEKPEFAPDCIYEIMLDCWKDEPKERPSFIELRDDLEICILSHLKKSYIEFENSLNEANDELSESTNL